MRHYQMDRIGLENRNFLDKMHPGVERGFSVSQTEVILGTPKPLPVWVWYVFFGF